MEELNNILEKISTFNINANTDLDVQGIIDTYMKFDMTKTIVTAVLSALTVIIVAYMIFSLIKKGIEETKKEEALEKMNQIIDNFGSWSKVEKIEERLKDIQEFIPRNKRRTNID